MGGLDILILAVVALALFFALRRMKRGGCCGCCGDCRNCGKKKDKDV